MSESLVVVLLNLGGFLLVSQLLVEFFVPIQYTGTLYSIMNEELIKRQLTFLGFVAGTTILYAFNDR